jgi:hypothetical protein
MNDRVHSSLLKLSYTHYIERAALITLSFFFVCIFRLHVVIQDGIFPFVRAGIV